jgi:hypothetical protein
MKYLTNIKSLILAAILFVSISSLAQNPINWTGRQLMEPSELAKNINAKGVLPVIISVGPGATIPNSVDVGLVNNQEGLDKLKSELKTLPKNKKIVIYCGCCPFDHCPNVRPAIEALKSLQFTNYFLLNLPHNVKTDWIDKGYPVSKS